MKKVGRVYVAETVIVEPNIEIGEGTSVWHYSHIREGARIGKNCVIGKYVEIGLNVRMGDDCRIQNLAQIYEGVILGNEVFVGPGVIFVNDTYPTLDEKACEEKRKKGYEKTTIEDRVSIGAGSIIMPVNIGEGSLIGAGSVVTKDVPKNSLVYGVPSRFRGTRKQK